MTVLEWAGARWIRAREAFSQTFDLRDAFCFSGLAMVGYGLAQVYEPSAWIVCGAALFWLGVRSIRGGD